MCALCNGTSWAFRVVGFPMVLDWLGKGVKLGNLKINKYNFLAWACVRVTPPPPASASNVAIFLSE